MSWQQSGSNFVRSSRNRTWSGVRRWEMQISGVRLPARVVRREDSQQHTTNAVDGLDTDWYWFVNECERPVALRSDTR